MERKVFSKISFRKLVLFVCLIPMFLVGCGNGSDTVEAYKRPDVPYQPSQPVVINSFSPKEGSVRTQILIKGSNFGTDISQIKVMMDTVCLNVISSDGSMIYASIPASMPSKDRSPLVLQIGKGSTMQEVKTAEEFVYVVEPYVSTLAGYLNPRDQSSPVKDGPIMLPGTPGFDPERGAQFEQPTWLTFDQDKNLYLLEEHHAIRFIDKDHTYVNTKFTKGNNYGRFRTAAFSLDWTKLYVTNDADNWTDLGTGAFTKESDFKQYDRIINSRQCNGGAVHPIDGVYFFNSYEQGQVFKWNGPSDNPDGKSNSKELFKIQDVRWEFNIQFEPEGNFAYIVVINRHYILKSYYNWEKQELELPVLFAGVPTDEDKGSHKDGVATAARFKFPYQGAFDEEGNFYVCDKENHCIRKITPEGIVSTFAGRPGEEGYSDGPLRDAQFKHPTGIVYDKDEKIFYVADRENKRIRMITMPK